MSNTSMCITWKLASNNQQCADTVLVGNMDKFHDTPLYRDRHGGPVFTSRDADFRGSTPLYWDTAVL